MTTLERAITISPEYSDLVSKLSDIEFNALKQSIQNNGQQIPIIVNQNGVILDGHHRYRACAELGIPPKTAVMTFNTQDEERLFVIDANLVRRQLNAYQRGVLALKKKPILANIALENMKQGRVSQNKETLHVDEQLAKEAGMSKGQLYKVEKIDKEGSDRLKQMVRNDELSINKAFKLIGKNIDAYLAIDDHVEDIKQRFAELEPGSAEYLEALRYFRSMKSAVADISAGEWKDGTGAIKAIIAMCGGFDKFTLVQIFHAFEQMNESEVAAIITTVVRTEEEKDAYESLRTKRLAMKWHSIVEFSSAEMALVSKLLSWAVDNSKNVKTNPEV